jgi:hypothetical protein
MADSGSPWRDEATLRRLYQEQELSQKQIAEKFGASQATISTWMSRFGIPTRDHSRATRLAVGSRHPHFSTDGKGYERASAREPRGSVKHVLVHRLVAVAEHGFGSVAGNDVHHQNNIPFDNRPSNLEVIDPIKHRREHGQSFVHDQDGAFDGSKGGVI